MWSTPVARYCNDLIDTLVVDVCDTLTESVDVVDLEQPTVETHIKNLDLINCAVTVNSDLGDPQPLLLRPGGTKDGFGFKLPTPPSDVINFNRGETVRIACPGSFITARGAGVTEAVATCVTGRTFTIEGFSYDFRNLVCSSYPWHTARNTGRTCNSGRASEIEIGFQVGTDFFRVLDVCFDNNHLNPLWTKFDLVGSIGGYQRSFPRPSWIRGAFYPGVSPDNQYLRANQIATIGEILGSQALGERYVSRTTDFYLARGHLVAKADYVYGSQHRATFYYVNAAPQWQTFNGGNWERLESSVRNYASSRRFNLVVYTGTYGVTTLPNARGQQRELYLYNDANGNHALPIPKVFWKVVYNPVTRAGAVFLGVNNPYLTTLTNDYLLCADVSNRISWLLWSPNNLTLGYSYVCEVNDFRRAVPTLPSFTVTSLLT
uniref:DNA/RNA non-specific endonuclease domain-containing protein n=1 Tax=Timema douglasi TaxID=61478 RepID=A0A7R8VP86_TIMDO|nr:unnamed protein product [Timema douglasi]